MIQDVKFLGGADLGGGVVTLPNFFALQPNQSPNALNVKFGIGGTIEKRLGTSTLNSVALEGTAGWGSFDFGASAIRWLIVSAGTGIYASSNRGLTFVRIASSRSQDAQWFERSRSFLIATSEARDPVVYWDGSANTTISTLAAGSAPAVKYAIAYQGFLFLMNSATRNRGMYYAPEPDILTDPWDSSFDLPSSFDDEITGAILLDRKLYVSMRYRLFRVSFVGGNPDFAYQDIKDWGWVPGTVKKITLPEVGEVIVALDWNKNLRIFDGSEDQIISDGFRESNGESAVYFQAMSDLALTRCRAETDTKELVYKLLAPIGGSGHPSHAICFNYRTGAFYPYDYRSRGFLRLQMAQSSNSQLLLGIDSGGRVHTMDSGNLDSGVDAVNEFYDSQFHIHQNPQTVSKTQKLALYFSPTSSGNIRFQDRIDFSNAFRGVRHDIAFTDTGAHLQKAVILDVPLTQNIYQFRISNSGSTLAPWRLHRVEWSGKPLGVGKA